MSEPTVATNIVLLRALEVDSARVGERLQALLPSLRAAQGCLGYSAVDSLEKPGEWVVCGIWSSNSAMRAHFESAEIQGVFRLLDCRLVRSLECQCFAA
ncbi:antibiotic biosynthesis monooxygenase family protein [Pseudomonas akapageensis]|uniref:antibiotic biosynthesis monooxygenase family protein n=1 Tax=Pseudomonas akapageensis TaxID=2609961 RepID=UPI00140B1D66|nr:antibiotic biosynthesis monooxygenase family protein [Pseudomonas akapageensis]